MKSLPVLEFLESLDRTVFLEHTKQELILLFGTVTNVNLVGLAQLDLLLDVDLDALGQLGLAAREGDLRYGVQMHQIASGTRR